MTLVLEIEYLSGVCFAAIGPDGAIPDWPPQPDRIFSALTATWAMGGECEEEAAALQWLERLPPPMIAASRATARTPAIAFVPPNDAQSDKEKHAAEVLPAMRGRKPRRFPAARPRDPTIQMIWMISAPDEGTLAALQRLARDTAYVGHSASLTRCRFILADGIDEKGSRFPERRVYAGRLAELRRHFAAGRRPQPGAHVAPPSAATVTPGNVFSERWLLLTHVSGEMPDIRAAALVAGAIRDALLSGYRRLGLGDRVPEMVSGHAADGTPSRATHLAIIALPFVGFPYADGHVMGFGLVPPRGSTILDDDDFRRLLRLLAPMDESSGRRVLTIAPKRGAGGSPRFYIGLSPTFEAPANVRSLDPSLYAGPARCFATLTPIVLDRHLKQRGEARQQEIAAQVLASCRNIGLPEPELVVPGKHPAMEGAPSAYPSGRQPTWTRWQLPPPLASRWLTHAVIRFPHEVMGPTILGAGRYLGLGLCRPLDPERR